MPLLAEDEQDTLVACWEALGAVTASIPKEMQPSFVRCLKVRLFVGERTAAQDPSCACSTLSACLALVCAHVMRSCHSGASQHFQCAVGKHVLI